MDVPVLASARKSVVQLLGQNGVNASKLIVRLAQSASKFQTKFARTVSSE